MADLLPGFMKGNAAAIDCLMTIHRIVETWDDIIDKDQPLTPEDINGAFYQALVTLPRNPFYRDHFAELNPVFESAILDWFLANKLEAKGDTESLRGSFMLRCGVLSLTVISARIIGGVEWANKVNQELRSAGEGWDDYVASFGVK